MPFYDLRCTKCKNEFNIRASVDDRTKRRIACPECGAHELDAVFKTVNYSVKAEPACPNAASCGAACPHSHAG